MLVDETADIKHAAKSIIAGATFDNNLHFDTSVGDGYASWSVEIKKAKSSGSNRGSVSNIDTECRRYVMVIRKEEKCERGRKKNKKLF